MVMREISYSEALYEAVRDEMDRDDSVFVYGLGVDDPKGMYGTTLDLHKKFGEFRNFDTPLSEDAMTGFGIGAALSGMRPIHVHQRMDFLLLCMNQLINIAAKTRYMFGSNYSVPMVVRAIIGRSWGQGAQHSQSFHSFFTHVPGLQVVAPTTPYDAKGCMVSAIRSNNPVVFLEHRMLYKNKGHVPDELYEIKPGKSRVLVEGDTITIVAISHMVVEAVRAASLLKEVGINAEVIDPVYLAPMDMETIVNSVLKTKKLLVVDHSWTSSGLSSEIVAKVMEDISGSTPVKAARMGYAECPCPTTRSLEDFFYPTPNSIAKKAYSLVSGKEDWIDRVVASTEINEFKGPF